MHALNPPDAARPPGVELHRNRALAILLVVYTFNFVDRTVLSVVSQAVKVDLHITDAQLGLLSGFAFALFYTGMSFPLARLVERGNRVTIISVSLFVWSGMTALCGAAQNMVHLALCRIGVGIGEAGCSPAAHSIIADYFEPERRSSALSIYALGISLGVLVGAAMSGWVAQTWGWRVAFAVAGVPGMAFALIVKLLLREPPRGYSDPAPLVEAGPPPPLMAVIRRLFGKPTFVHMLIGASLASFADYGISTFASAYFIRRFDVSFTEAGFVFGIIGGVSTGISTLVGGLMADKAGRRDKRWYMLIPALGLLLALPFYVAGYLQPVWGLAAAILVVPGLFACAYLGPVFGTMHNMVEPRMRGSATAILYFAINFIGLGGGPLFTGWATDRFAAYLFAAQGKGSFAAVCGASSPPADLAATCHSVLANATQLGIVVTLAAFLWAAVHFLLAARTIRADLQD